MAPSCESHYSSFYCRIADAMHTRCGMPSRGVHSPSVCPSVTFVDSVKTIMSSKVFHRRVATPFYSFSTPNVMAIFRRGYPRTNVEPSRGRQKSRFSANIWLSDRRPVLSDQQLRQSTMQCTTQTATHRRILFITTNMDDHDEENRTQQNLIMYAAVNLKPK